MEASNNQQVRLEIGNLINQGWELTKKNFPAFLLVIILEVMVSSIVEMTHYSPYMELILSNGPDITKEQMMQMLWEEGRLWSWIGGVFVTGIAVFFINYYLSALTYRMLNTAVEGKKIDLTAEFKETRHSYWFFLGAYIVYSLIICIGAICCILPGIYLAVRFMFTPMIAANHPEITFNESFSRSWQMTKGRFWKLLWMCIVIIGINIVGLICCCVGLLVSTILSYMMYACAYKYLSPSQSATEEAIAEEAPASVEETNILQS